MKIKKRPEIGDRIQLLRQSASIGWEGLTGVVIRLDDPIRGIIQACQVRYDAEIRDGTDWWAYFDDLEVVQQAVPPMVEDTRDYLQAVAMGE